MKSLGISEILFIFCFHSKQWCCESFQHLRIKGYIKWKFNLLLHLPKALANMIYLRGNINTPSSTSCISTKQMCFQSAILLNAVRYYIHLKGRSHWPMGYPSSRQGHSDTNQYSSNFQWDTCNWAVQWLCRQQVEWVIYSLQFWWCKTFCHFGLLSKLYHLNFASDVITMAFVYSGH